MDFRIGLSLLLLLTYASCGAWSKSTRDGPTPRHHRHHRQVQRPPGALSEFLVPPPAPAHLRGGGPRGPPPPHQSKGNQPPPPPVPPPPLSPPQKHTRNGRYVNQQGSNNNNNGPGYFSKFMSWLNPFNGVGGGGVDSIGKDSHGEAASNYPRQTAQYAPHMPYTGVNNQYEAPPHPANLQNSYSNLAGWMSGKTCNPCNQIPWIPVVRENVQNNHGQYAPSAPNNAYLAPPPPQEVKPPDYSHSGPVGPPSGNQQHYPIPNPHLYPGVIPPLYKAKPFNDPPADYSAPNANQPPPNFDHQSAPTFDHPAQPNFNQPPPNFDHQPPSNFDHQPPSNFDHQSAPNFDHQSQPNFNQPPPNFNQQPSYNNQPPSNYDHPTSSNFGDSPPQNYDHQPSPNFNSQQSIELDHPPTNFDQQNFEDHPPQNFDHQPPIYDQQQSQNYDYQPSGNFNSGPPSNYEDHPPSNFEQHHQSSQIVDVVEEAPTHLDNVEPHQEPDHAESRPVFVNSATETDIHNEPQKTTATTLTQQSIVHFQRSPLIDLSVPGESSTTTTIRPTLVTILPPKGNRELPTPPAATVIDYIVSGPEEPASFSSSEEEKETRPTHQSVTTTSTQRTTTAKQDQRLQESLIETLVQSYEFYKKRNDTKSDELPGGRLYNDTIDDFSASKEFVVPNKVDNGKKNKQIIQIIIPYTSQYTPSPFHPTHSINGHAKNPHRITAPTTTTTTTEESNDEDNVVIQESRRVSVTRDAPDGSRLRNNRTNIQPSRNSIDVHRLQKNIDNWTIQEYSKSATSVTSSPNSTYPRWLSSKQIPDEYLLSTTEVDESSEYYDFSNETDVHRGTNKTEEPTTTPESVTKVNIVNATYPKKPDHSSRNDEHVYVVTPVPNPNSLEDLSSSEKEQTKSRSRKGKQKEPLSVERAYQVLPQAVNNLAALSSAPDSAAPALWGIMEHEEFAASVDQPRWRSESDILPDPASTPILYAGHSKVSRAR